MGAPQARPGPQVSQRSEPPERPRAEDSVSHRPGAPAAAPRFSVLTPVFETGPALLEEMLASVASQSFGDWEHVLVDDGSASPQVWEWLVAAARADGRVRVVRRELNGGIVAATNDALAVARGEFVALLDHDDVLHSGALAAVSAALDAHDDVDFVYTDEDIITMAGRRSSPYRKPDWSPETLCSQMYTCHLSVFRRSVVEAVGGYRAGFDGSQDYDLTLRVGEVARRVVHVPEVLYHWRAAPTSVAGNADAKPHAFENARRAVGAHLARVGFEGVAVRDRERVNLCHIEPRLVSEPLVSVVLPTAGSVREVRGRWRVLVEGCVESLLERATWGRWELVLVVDPRTDAHVVERVRSLARERLRLVPSRGEFNFAAMVNAGVAAARGEQVLLLNDDTEVLSPDFMERLLVYSLQPDIGAVGAKLYFGDGRIQHVGVVAFEGRPAHCYWGYRGSSPGYFANARFARNCLAVTGACLMVGKDKYDEVGGMSTSFPISYNDVDLCLKLGHRGYRTVVNPNAELHHFESSTRVGLELPPDELALLRRRWASVLDRDPYYGAGFAPETPNFVSVGGAGG
ncbi:MAG: glycosyltransferase [Acidimicrobiia bacterium]|nr:glycosyltransferase [Acidimicrobiia bacterium]